MVVKKIKKNQFHKRTTLGPETVRKQISDQKIGELSTEQLKAHDQKSHQLISYFYFAGSKEQFLGPEIFSLEPRQKENLRSRSKK